MDKKETGQWDPAQAEHGLMDLFETLSFRKRIRKVLHGLKQPQDSGEYKYARLQMLRLLAPVSAVIIPLLMVILIMLVPEKQHETEQGATVIRREREPDVPEVEPEKPPDEPIVSPRPPDLETPIVLVPGMEESNPAASASDNPVHNLPRPNAVPVVKSQRYIPEFYMARSPEARTKALGDGKAPPFTEETVMRALRWLKREQKPDGSWEGPSSAMASLALLAYLAHDETHESEEFGVTVEKALRFLIDDQKENGRFKSSDNEEYALPITAYALCEAYSMTRIPTLKFAAEKAIQAILDGQNPGGGWTYQCLPSRSRTDTSYSAWCAQALSAAAEAGLNVRSLNQARSRAVAGLKKNVSADGAFGYTRPGENSAAGDVPGALTGAGILSLQLLGAGNDRETQAGRLFLEKVSFNWNEPGFRRPIYNWYYITQVKFHAGGPAWEKWNKAFANGLVKNQVVLRGAGLEGKDIGYWEDVTRMKECNLVYNTTLCTLMLEVYYRQLASYKTPKVLEPEVDLSAENNDDAEDDVKVQVFPG